MTIDYEALKNRSFPDVVHTYGTRDTILYALGVGLPTDPLDERQLAFVYEKGLRALPTMAVILGYPGFWLKEPDTGVDWVKVLHGEQGLELFAPLPVEGTVIGRTRVTEIVDKGPGKGALIYQTRDVLDAAGERLLARLSITTFARGDGGFGGPSAPTVPIPAPHPVPDRPPDATCTLDTSPRAALLYRLSGDPNPLHADPAVARAAGYDRPILHGLATLGVAGHAILRTLCDYDPSRLTSLRARFSRPVFPGEPIRTDLWRDGDQLSFQCTAPTRDTVVLSNGHATLAER